MILNESLNFSIERCPNRYAVLICRIETEFYLCLINFIENNFIKIFKVSGNQEITVALNNSQDLVIMKIFEGDLQKLFFIDLEITE